MTELEQAVVAAELGVVNCRSSPGAVKQKAVLRAAMGHLVPVLVGLPLVVTGQVGVTSGEWILAFLAVALVWGGLWLALRVGWDRALAFDPHFLLIPAGLSAPLIGLYILLVPELRLLLLPGWYAVLLFGAGLLGFRASLALSTIMAVVYLGVVEHLISSGEALSWAFEVSALLLFYALCFFCSDILERLRRDQREMKSLRRQMSKLALTDQLTALPNRRHLEQALERQAAQSRRTGIGYSLALLDLDHLKEINDTHGHEAGDRVLGELAEILRRALRRADLVGRLGGDEFAILMSETGLDEAALVLERVRCEVQSHCFSPISLHRHQVTVSIGLTEALPDDPPAEVLRLADDRLYVAKRCGRNRVALSLDDATRSHPAVAPAVRQWRAVGSRDRDRRPPEHLASALR